MDILIKGGHVIDPGSRNGLSDLFIRNGKIQEVGEDLTGKLGLNTSSTTEMRVIDASGWLVLPGFVDLHVHLREPGLEYKETIESGTASALAGGFTSVCCMPNTQPVNDNQSVTEFILGQARAAGNAGVFPVGAITKRSEGEELAEIGELKDAGCVALSDDGRPVMNSLLMRRAMEYAVAFDLPVVDHCEDLHLSNCGCMNEGIVSTELGLPGIPAAAEEVMVARNLSLSSLTGSHLHLAHVSTAESVRMIREAKERGVRVTAEVTPHHFTITEDAVRGFETDAKMNPPLRTREDIEALKQGLKDGTIDCIATDHAPHATQEKQLEFAEAPFGVVGLETALPLTLALVEEGVLSLEAAIGKLTKEPADIFKLKKGTLTSGADADVALVDPRADWIVDASIFKSKSRNTPFSGWKVRGRVKMTIVGGKIGYEGV